MPGIIGRKIGMTSFFDENGRSVACTVIEAGPCVVTQIKTVETDGYEAIQLAYGEKKESHTSKALSNHFKKANTTPKKKLVEFKPFGNNLELGSVITVTDILEKGQKVAVIGTSKGKGFQGVVKRHGFAGVGEATRGQHNRMRHPGSIGACSYPARVFKGIRMAGRMGSDQVKIKNLKVLQVYPEKNLVLVTGSIPGAINSFVLIEK